MITKAIKRFAVIGATVAAITVGTPAVADAHHLGNPWAGHSASTTCYTYWVGLYRWWSCGT